MKPEENSQYLDLRFMVPTSNLCERLFSKAGYSLGNRRGNILPTSFEEQIFLHVNSKMWSIDDVNTLVNGKENK